VNAWREEVERREREYGGLVLDGRVGERAAVGTELRYGVIRETGMVVSTLIIEPHRPGGSGLVYQVFGVDLSEV